MRVRSGDVMDYPLFARLFPELEVADPLPTGPQFATQMLPNVVVGEVDGVAAGYAHWRLYDRTAHVVHVVVGPEARRRGLARALLDEVRDRVRAAGCSRWYLNVKQDNVPAIRVYQRIGMNVEQEGWSLELAWSKLDELPRSEQPGPLECAIVPASDDATIAAQFGLDRGRIAALRQKPDEALYALYREGVPVAFGGFDPNFPGVYPVCVARTSFAHPLFRAFRRHARHEHVHVTVEGDRALYALLRAAGGELRHAFVRMGAALTPTSAIPGLD
jgi:GNAT superfamily N-acetyltransferase